MLEPLVFHFFFQVNQNVMSVSQKFSREVYSDKCQSLKLKHFRRRIE